MSSPSDFATYKRLLMYALPAWKLFLISIVGFFLFAAADVLLADLMQFIIDSLGSQASLDMGVVSKVVDHFVGLEGATSDQLRIIIPAAMMILATMRGVGFVLGNYFIRVVARQVIHSMRCAVFDHLVDAPSSYYDQNTNGFLISKITFNVEQVADAVTNAIRTVVREGFLVIGLLAYLLYINWKLSLVLLAITPLIALVVAYVGKRFRRISRRIQNSMGDITHVSSEAISGYREVRMFGAKDVERQRFFKASEYNRVQYLKMALTDALSPPILQMFISMALAILVWLVLAPEMSSTMSPGQFVAFLAAAGMLHKPVRQLSEVYSVIQKGLAAAEDIFELLDSERERDTGTQLLGDVRGEVSFQQVDFYYTPERKVLEKIDLHVAPGETVALVGLSGSGKSTLMALLTRFYEVSAGKICIDGISIEALPLDELRQHIALVSQQVTLFNDTIYNNIAYGCLADADPADVHAAITAAHADDFIAKLPQGLQTMVGDDGVLLSGGQRQRIALARALLKNAPILILDEATSALDNESERYIQQALDEVMKERTTFVIAHRLSTIEQADRIVVMEQGQIVEQGVHADLLKAGGRYAQLHSRQFEGA
ncbi:MAG TPA: lipid A export permease/ATP-binding protein MsbA [Pseudomonadales bacterium]|nr:lipid A export permease/ATP-binding protein MsbA [Pseudomonadales bacterium]